MDLKLKKKIILIGASGFAGTNIAKQLLKNKIKFYAPKKKNINLLKLKSISKFGKIFKNSIIIFCAGKHRFYGDNYDLQNKNTKMIENLFKVLKNNIPKKIIFFSSVEVYGLKVSKNRINEKSKTKPLNNYAKCKLEQEKIIINNAKKMKFKFYIMRITGFYNKKDPYSVISKFYKISKKNQIIWHSSGNELRDYIHVDDLSKIIVRFVKFNYKVGFYNIVSGKSQKLKNIFFKILSSLKIKKKIKFYPNKKEFNMRFDNSKLIKVIGNFKFFSI